MAPTAWPPDVAAELVALPQVMASLVAAGWPAAFCFVFDVERDVQVRVLHAALVGMVLMYLGVLAAIVHLVFYRDARAMAPPANGNGKTEKRPKNAAAASS